MLTWDHGLTLLAIGHVNGLSECIRVSTELEYSRYTSVKLIDRIGGE